MRLSFLLTLALLTAMIGCKKDEDNNPTGPSAPPDTWLRVLEIDSSYEFATDVAQTSDGGYVLVGSYNSMTGQGNRAWKVNSVGDTLWSHSFAVDGFSDMFQGVTALSDGGALLVGRVHPTGSTTEEALLVHINESGSVIWQKETDFERGYAGYSAAATSDGNFIIATLGGLMKINANGDTVWTRQYGNLQFLGAVALNDGGALVSGTQYLDTENAVATVLRVSAQGDSVWSREFPLAGMRMYPWKIVRVGDGDYVTAGQYEDFPSGDAQGGWAAKISETGQARWSNTYADNGYFKSLAVGSDGLPLTVGEIQVLPNIGDILLTKLDNSGDEVWSKTFLTGRSEFGYSLTATSDRGFLIGGTIDGVVYPDILLIKVDENGEI